MVAGLIRLRAWFLAHPSALAIFAGLAAIHGWWLWKNDLVLTLIALTSLWTLSERSGKYRHGLVFGLAYFLPITHWLGVFVGKWTGSPILYALAWGFVALGLALPLALIVPVAHRLLSGRGIWTLPLVWIFLELFRSYVPVLAFPWGLLAHPDANERGGITALSAILGEYGVGGLYVLLSLVTRQIATSFANAKEQSVSDERRSNLRIWTVLVTSILVMVGFEFARSRAPQPNLTLAAYQPGLDLAYGPYARSGPARTAELAGSIAEAREAQNRLSADLIVLPEGLIASSDPSDLPRVEGLGTLLLGGQRKAGNLAYQTAFAFDGQTGKWESADKTRLVIFGEFVPGRGVIPYPPSFALPGGDLAAASELRMIDAHTREGKPFRVGPILCFEALFPDIAYRQKMRGADVLAVMSLDDWFVDTKAPEWLEWAARWRAAETGLPLVRVGSMGYTTLIDGKGKAVRKMNWGERGAVVFNPSRN